MILKFEVWASRRASSSWLTQDFLGFGLPDKPARDTYSLVQQADIARRVVAMAE